MFDRYKLLIGENNFNIVKEKTVLIVGIGGVGGYAFESLVRLGINNFIIIDSDVFEETNINRQILATTKTIGQNKVDIALKRAKEINNEINIVPMKEFLQSNMDVLENFTIDYIVDTCDTITAKIHLIKYAIKKDIKIISCMGTGNRVDATALTITTLDKTQNDPLARIMRKKLREENVTLKIPVVASNELPTKHNDTIASCSYVPAVAGLYITNYIANDILKDSTSTI